MDIVAYRGPQAAGGVASVLQTIFTDPRLELNGWWFFAKNRFKRITQLSESSSLTLAAFSNDLIDDHYSYCNQFLWPMFHEFSDRAAYDARQRLAYRRLNRLIAQTIAHSHVANEYFIHDYQLALVPRFLQMSNLADTTFFWHIPWPESIPESCTERAIEIAAGICAATKIGFQTQKDATNFINFCHRTVPQASDLKSRIEIAPVPVDHELWALLSHDQLRAQKVLNRHSIKEHEKIVLSVERADYTKGILERLHAIELYLQHNAAQAKGSVRFMQVIPRTRQGIDAYDLYWQQCRTKVDEINKSYGTPDWQPIAFIEEGLAPTDLAVLYARADVMLITSLLDGLNLTAKEYVSCQREGKGALILSQGCGASSELPAALIIDPRNPAEIVRAVQTALSMPAQEIHQRMRHLREAVRLNSSTDWFQRTGSFEITKPLAKVT